MQDRNFWCDAMGMVWIAEALARLASGRTPLERTPSLLKEGRNFLEELIQGITDLDHSTAPKASIIPLLDPTFQVAMELGAEKEQLADYFRSLLAAFADDATPEDRRRGEVFFTKLAQFLTSQLRTSRVESDDFLSAGITIAAG